MTEVVISREVSTDEIADAIRGALGEKIEITRDGNALSVSQGYWKRASVTTQPGSETTSVVVTGRAPPALLLALVMKIANTRTFAPSIAAAIQARLG